MSVATPFGPEAFADKVRVSRETLDRLKIHVDLLRVWSTRHNLVSRRSLDDVWRRHVWDSAQLAAFVPRNTAKVADLGSGAGFPGLVLATLLQDRALVTLYEATRKKAEFLEHAARSMDLKVEIRNMRVEDERSRPFDVVAARALAPLDVLLDYSQRFCTPRTVCLFLKGQSVAAELTEARKSWRMMKVSQHQSATDPSGVILEIRELGHVGARSGPKDR
jgi:16S rRNA (guanine527-N7)-methyltransferase